MDGPVEPPPLLRQHVDEYQPVASPRKTASRPSRRAGDVIKRVGKLDSQRSRHAWKGALEQGKGKT